MRASTRHALLAVVLLLGPGALVSGFDLQGHRGSRGLAPENTLPAFARALSLGVSTLELDLALTRDGVLVVAHDPHLNGDLTRGPDGRWLGARGPALFSLSFVELQRYDVGRLRPGSAYAARFPAQVGADGVHMPRLADVFALVERSGNRTVRFNLETKLDPRDPAATASPEALADALVAAVRERGLAARVTVQSFDWRSLARVRTQAPEIELSCLSAQQPEDDTIQAEVPGPKPWLAGLDPRVHGGSVPRLVAALGARVWSPHFRDVTAERLREARGLDLRVLPWTVNEPPDMARLIDLGVAGLITDYPDRLRAVLREKGLPLPAPTPVEP